MIPIKGGESKERSVAHVSHDCCTRVGHSCANAKLKAHTVLERFDIFAWDLLSGGGRDAVLSALYQWDAYHGTQRRGACLRPRFAHSFGKANHSQWA